MSQRVSRNINESLHMLVRSADSLHTPNRSNFDNGINVAIKM
jgi:hypothetical protein